MRNLFWIILLANVILFAVMQRGGLDWGEPAMQAQPDLHGDMIRLIPISGPQNAPTALSAPVAESAPAPVSAAVPASAVASISAPVSTSSAAPSNLQLSLNMAGSAAPRPGAPVCLEWGDFSGPDLARATAELSTMQLGDKISQRQIERDIGYWVYIPPLRNRAAVNRKIGELKALGVREYFVVQVSGRWLNAISLGVFKTEDAAQNFLADLHTKGVHTARVGERASKLKTTIFVLNEVDAGTQEKLVVMQKDFAGSELDTVPCTLTK